MPYRIECIGIVPSFISYRIITTTNLNPKPQNTEPQTQKANPTTHVGKVTEDEPVGF